MLKLGLSDIITYSIATGACFIFAAVWMLIADRHSRIMRNELKRMKSKIEEYEREKYLLTEKLTAQENSPYIGAASLNNGLSSDLESKLKDAENRIADLVSENDKIKKERDEAKSSLEEVYKALGG